MLRLSFDEFGLQEENADLVRLAGWTAFVVATLAWFTVYAFDPTVAETQSPEPQWSRVEIRAGWTPDDQSTTNLIESSVV